MKKTISFLFEVLVTLAILGSCGLSSSINNNTSNQAKTYFVSVSGDDNNSGLSETEAWRHIAFAASQAKAGDKVFVKVGKYLAENVVFSNNGTKDKPIIFVGYQNIVEETPNLNWKYGDSLDASVMPLLDGEDRSKGTAVELSSKSFIEFKNFQITNYEIGIYAWGADNLLIENVVGMNFGDIDKDYSGSGIVIGSEAHDNRIRNCIIQNAAAEGIAIVGDNNILEKSSVYADDNSTGQKSATDYYIHVSGNNNTVKACYAERIGDLEHGGHGIGIKGHGENNLIIDSTAKNLSGAFYVRHSGVKNNMIENCTVIDSDIGLLIRDGANHNTFKGCQIFNAYDAISFIFSKEDEKAKTAGNDNLITHCLVRGSRHSVISFSRYAYAAKVSNNRFENCVFFGAAYLFESERSNENNMMINSIISEIDNYSTGMHAVNFEFAYNDFWDNGFSTPNGKANISKNPLFVDSENNDFHLKSEYGRWDEKMKIWKMDSLSSPVIDAGNPESDYENEPKGNGDRINMGLFGNTAFASKTSH